MRIPRLDRAGQWLDDALDPLRVALCRWRGHLWLHEDPFHGAMPNAWRCERCGSVLESAKKPSPWVWP